MTHLKRQSAPKTWPVPKKGTAYMVKPLSNLKNTVPLTLILRDILKICKNRREVKRAIQLRQIKVNSREVKDDKISLSLFDTMEIIPSKRHYRIGLSEKGKFEINEEKEQDSKTKVAKIINKKTLNGKKTQINLGDGQNFLSEIKCKVNDSAVVNLKDRKIEKLIPLKENSRIMVFAGKHSGEKGTVKEINSEKKIAVVEINGVAVNAIIKQIMAIE